MDKLNFIGSLDEEQAGNAVKVARIAREAGVDPTLAVAIAFKESSLRTNAPRGSSGEIGMMQVMPSTGKGLGYDEEKLANPNQNIKAGIQYLKQGLQATENDPKLAAIYYNGGPGAVEALKSGKEPDPRVFDYVRLLNSYGTFSEQQPAGQRPSEQNDDMVVADAPPPPPPPPPKSDTSGAKEGERFLGGALGAGAGLASIGAKAASAARTNMAVNRAAAEEAARISARRAAGMAPSGAPAAPVAPGSPPGTSIMRQTPPMGLADAGRMASGQTGAMTYNYGKAAGLTDIEAARALDMTKQAGGVHDLSNIRREGIQKIGNLFPTETWRENPRYGGIMTPDQGVGSGPRQSYVFRPDVPPSPDLPKGQPGGLQQLPQRAPIPTAPPSPGGLQQVTDFFKGMMRPIGSGLSTVGKYLAPPLAGLGAGLDAAELAHEYRKPEDQRDYLKMGLQGAGIVGGALSMFPPTARFGVPLSLGTFGAQQYLYNPEVKEYIRKKFEREQTLPRSSSRELYAP